MENFIFCADTHKHPLPLLNKVCNGIQEVPVYHRYSHFLVKKWLRLCCLNYRFVFILCALRFSVLYDLLKFQDRWWILSKVILCDILYKVDPNMFKKFLNIVTKREPIQIPGRNLVIFTFSVFISQTSS